MSYSPKKLLFVVVGLTLTIAIVLGGKHYLADAAVQEGEQFGDWAIACEKNKDDKKVCFLTQSAQNEKKEKVYTLQIGYLGEKKELTMIQILPFGVALQAGTMIVADKKEIAAGKFFQCLQYGCIAIAQISDEGIKNIFDAKEVGVGMVIADAQKTLMIPISTNGLQKGLAALK